MAHVGGARPPVQRHARPGRLTFRDHPQRDSTARQLSEADALNQYQRARTNLDQTLGKTLDDYNVSLEEAQRGVVGREPDLIPVAGGNR